MTDNEHQGNFETFRDWVSGPVIQRLLSRPAKPSKSKAAKNRRNGIKSVVEVQEEGSNEAADLADFVDVHKHPSYHLNIALRILSTWPQRYLDH